MQRQINNIKQLLKNKDLDRGQIEYLLNQIEAESQFPLQLSDDQRDMIHRTCPGLTREIDICIDFVLQVVSRNVYPSMEARTERLTKQIEQMWEKFNNIAYDDNLRKDMIKNIESAVVIAEQWCQDQENGMTDGEICMSVLKDIRRHLQQQRFLQNEKTD